MGASELTDEAIAGRVQQGDIESFGLLMERYEAKLMRYGKRFLSDHEDVKDLVQDVFIKAYTNIQSFDGSRRFSPWIYRIAHNTFVNALKRKWTERIFPFDFDLLFSQPMAKETADADIRAEDARHMLDQCLSRMDAKYREPLILRYFEDMDYKEIAAVLQIPVATVGVRLQRGRAMLKALCKQSDELYVQS